MLSTETGSTEQAASNTIEKTGTARLLAAWTVSQGSSGTLGHPCLQATGPEHLTDCSVKLEL